MILHCRSYERVETVQDALRLLNEKPRVILAGGTDLGVTLQKGLPRDADLLYIGDIPEMKSICVDRDGIIIGAGVTISEIAYHADVKRRLPLLAEACIRLAGSQIRNRATLVGNIANASPAADGLAAVAALDGEVYLSGTKGGERRTSIDEFILGPRKVSRNPDELITHVRIPFQSPDAVSRYEKVGLRNSMSIGVVNLAADYQKRNGGVILRVVLGAVGPKPARCRDAEALVLDDCSPRACEEALQLSLRHCTPIADIRSSAEYRFHVCRNLLTDLFSEICGERVHGR